MDTPRSITEDDVVTALAGLPAELHREFRATCRDTADLYRTATPAIAGVWAALATCGHIDGRLGYALGRCNRDDLIHLDAVLRGAELGARRSPRTRAPWGMVRAIVTAELGARPEPAAIAPKPPTAPKPHVALLGGARTAAVLERLTAAGDTGLPTRALTGELGGQAVRATLARLRDAGRVETRNGRNYITNREE